MTEYGIFGAFFKEPPQFSWARNVLGVGRNANYEEIRKTYLERSREEHPDKNLENWKEANARFGALASAYKLLTDERAREESINEFQKALEQPFVVGNRLFSIGSLYGVRIFMPEGYGELVSDTRRLLASGNQAGSSYAARENYATVYGIRNSIMESQLADLLYTYYGSNETDSSKKLLEEAFVRRKRGGLDDLLWMRNNDLAADYFLKRRFKEASGLFEEVNQMVQDNIIFMYRQGICLEALAAQSRYQEPCANSAEENWRHHEKAAISLYEKCLSKLRKRKGAWLDSGYAKEFEPKSMLTVMMQLADAYAQMGAIGWAKSKELWGEIFQIDPSCYEARRKVGPLLQLPLRVAGLLSHRQR